MSKRLLILIPLVVIISGAFALLGINYIKKSQTSNPEEHANKDIHYHAGFQVYVDGELMDFSENVYMHESPCTVDGEPIENAHEDEQTEKAHLHDHTGDVVHVHREDATWGDLFTNIKYDFPASQAITVFAHGKEIENLKEYPIIPNDSIVILIGEYENPEEYVENAVTQEKIKEVEQKSETCSS